MTFEVKTIKIKDKELYLSRDGYFDFLPRKYIKEKLTRRFLGSGVYGEVYQSKEKDKVIKICDENTAYGEYVKALSKRRKANPHLPIIYDATVFKHKSNPEPVLAVEMERLYPLERASFADQWDMIGPQNESANIVEAFMWNKKLKTQWFLKGDKDIAEAIDFLNDTLQKIKKIDRRYGMDIHHNNIMLRKDGTPVVTDPFS